MPSIGSQIRQYLHDLELTGTLAAVESFFPLPRAYVDMNKKCRALGSIDLNVSRSHYYMKCCTRPFLRAQSR